MIFSFLVIFVLLFIIVGLVYQFLYDLYEWVLFLSILFYAAYVTVQSVFYYRKKKIVVAEKQQPLSSLRKEDQNMLALTQFISQKLHEGFKAQIIKDSLITQGWPKEKVEAAFRDVQ